MLEYNFLLDWPVCHKRRPIVAIVTKGFKLLPAKQGGGQQNGPNRSLA